MKKLLSMAVIALCSGSIWGQTNQSPCPPSTSPGIHIVQHGETLYGISKKYKVSIDQLSTWNNIQDRTLIRDCTTLIVADPSVKSKTVPTSYSNTPIKPNKTIVATPAANTVSTDSKVFHTIAKGETLSGIAEKYGYTLARLMRMNNMSKNDKISVGQVIRVNDCACNANVEAPISASKSVPQSYSNTPKKAESNNILTSNTEATVQPFTYSWDARYPKVIHIISQNDISQKETPQVIGSLYGLTGDEVLAMNGLDKNTPLIAGQRLTLEDRRQIPQTANATPTANTQVANNNIPTQYNTVAKPKDNTDKTTSVPAKTASIKVANNTAMTDEEMQMVNEVNLLRSNPAGYIPFIEQYIQYLKENGDMGNSIATSKELIEELKKTPNLPILETVPCLYVAAQKHGDDQRKRGDTNHQGSDGSWPWDRVTRECKDLKDGNENLVGGPSDIRRAVILLLVDDGIESRGHRKTLLQPDWKYIACHKMGTIGTMPNCWIQQFGL